MYTLFIRTSIKGEINIFGLFKRRSTQQSDTTENKNDANIRARETLNDAEGKLSEIESIAYKIKDQSISLSLIAFVSYYWYIIEFYNKNVESIISVKELLLLKYIDMVKDILGGFEEKNCTSSRRAEILEILKTIDNKLYSAVKDIREQCEMNHMVDLQTMHDLIKSDF